ncbi:MAG: signal peptidase I [Bacteroidetes bacterium]|nr:signal peptidase I [Bacteroidota bacterium]
MGFDSQVKYLGTLDKIPVRHKTIVQEWTDAIVFAVVAATLIRWLIMEAYTIPTPSMENSLLVGDFLFVSKFHYGTRTPRTPLQIPLTHQKIWFTDIPSYLDWIQLPSTRLPGLTSVKRNDVVVFNVPGMYENNLEEPDRSRWIKYPVDLKTPYIKRCVGISGDVIEVKDKQLYVNHQPANNPEEMQYRYHVVSKDEINKRNFDKLGLDPEDFQTYGRTSPDEVEYTMLLSAKKAEEVKALPYIKSIALLPTDHEADPRIFPASKYAPWNGDNFGPLTIPKEGMTIAINDSTLAMYGSTIRDYDHNNEVKIEGNKLIIDGKEVTQYTFKQNYYFMMGDNRDNSLDSRYWGFVPEDHVLGKGFFIWLSLDKYAGFFNKIRWSRFFKMIE